MYIYNQQPFFFNIDYEIKTHFLTTIKRQSINFDQILTRVYLESRRDVTPHSEITVIFA